LELKLKGKVVLVTGGSHGLGTAICQSLAAEGAIVGVNYRQSREKAEAVVNQLKGAYHVEAIPVPGDMAQEEDIVAMFDILEKEYSKIDILVNNAAFCPNGPITGYTKDEWEYTFQVNVTGIFVACRELVKRLMAAKRQGRIVNIVSQAAFRGSTSGHLPYDSSKGAIVSLTIALAREVAKHGIGVNAVAPGMVRTEMVAEIWRKNTEKYLTRIPLQRIAEPEEIANVVTFLASEASSYMTGATVDVSGGMMMR
jgi:3-oxoacyl-[acyl-carrier protein] reductase